MREKETLLRKRLPKPEVKVAVCVGKEESEVELRCPRG